MRVLETLTKELALDLKRASSVSAYVLNFIERCPFWEPSELKMGVYNMSVCPKLALASES